MFLEEHIDENMEEGAAFVDTVIQHANTLSPLCRFWKVLMMRGNLPAHEVEPWAETDILDDAQRSEVQDLLAKHYNARLQGGKLSDYDIRVDLFDSKAGLPVWDLTRVPAGKISENTRIQVDLETHDQVWCRPDESLVCKALRHFTKNPSISNAQLRAEFEAFVDNRGKSLADGFQTVCATPGDAESWMSVPLSEMVKGGYSQQVQRHNDKPLYRNTAANESAEWLLCTKKGSWAFCDSEIKERNTDGKVWGESVEAGHVSPISCSSWRISQDWLTMKGMPAKQAVDFDQTFLINLQVHGAPRTSLVDGAGVRSHAPTRSNDASACKGSSVGQEAVALNKEETAAERALFKQNKDKEKKSTAAFLKEWKLTLEDVDPYGDCQFLSVAQQLELLQRIRDGASTLILHEERNKLAMQLRADAVGCMQKPASRHHFACFFGANDGQGNALDGAGDDDFGGYCTRMSEPGQYGDEFTLKALALELNVSIQVFAWNSTLDKIRITRHSSNPDVNPSTYGEEPDAANVRATQGTVNIFHCVYQHGGGGHYNSIMQTEVKRSMHASMRSCGKSCSAVIDL